MTLIHLFFNECKLNLRFYAKCTITWKKLVQSYFWIIFGTSILNNLYNRMKYVFEQIICITAIENIYFPIKINKNMNFYFIWEDLVHFSNVSLN